MPALRKPELFNSAKNLAPEEAKIVNGTVLVLCVLAGLFFGAWPLVMRATKIDPFVAAFVLQVGSLMVILPFLRQRLNMSALVTFLGLVALFAGLMNGVGQIAFQKLVAMRSQDFTTALITIILLQIVITVLGEKMFYGGTITGKKIVGVAMAMLAVKLLIGK